MLTQAEKMIREGAHFIDVGAYSSRPGADEVSETEELRRIVPIVTHLTKTFPECPLSVDTFRSAVAKACLAVGAAMINDISGGQLDPEMLDTAAAFQVPYIAMHSRGTPKTMMDQTQYDDLIKEMIFYFSERIATANQKRLNDLIIDPGFGFAKTLEQNFELLNNLQLLRNLNRPMLIGISRKSMIYKTVKTTPKLALNGTTALHMIALQKGAHILRTHDVKEARECIQLHLALLNP